jgi:hypothetical protein
MRLNCNGSNLLNGPLSNWYAAAYLMEKDIQANVQTYPSILNMPMQPFVSFNRSKNPFQQTKEVTYGSS